MKVGVVLLAAGASKRMGKPKLLLPWGRVSILAHQLHLWQLLSAHQIVVVVASEGFALLAELNRLGFPVNQRIFNPHPELGMFSSIRCAAQSQGWDQALTHWVITLGDQPQVRLDTHQALLRFSAAHPDKVCQPRRLGRLHHPVILPRRVFQQLAAMQPGTFDEFLKARAGEVMGCEVDDAGLEFDIDTPQDYEKAISQFLKPNESGNDAGAASPLQGEGQVGG